MAIPLDGLPRLITAIGGLGTAAFGLVETMKVVVPVNHIGFAGIRDAVIPLTPRPAGSADTGLSQTRIVSTLDANWVNGTDLGNQKSIAKSLIKANLSAANAADLAAATGVDPATLKAVAESIAAGTPLTPPQQDVFGRFDFVVTAMVDEAYQRADQVYRNWTKALAMAWAVVLALAGSISLGQSGRGDLARALLVGVLATPLAPIAKDLSTALTTAVNALQAARK